MVSPRLSRLSRRTLSNSKDPEGMSCVAEKHVGGVVVYLFVWICVWWP